MKLAEHFTWAEVERSRTAVAQQIDNTVPRALYPNVLLMAARMEEIRTLLGDARIEVTSWYRCPALNTAIGSSDQSVHPLGLAVDFRPDGMDLDEAFERIRTSGIPFDQLIIETAGASRWIHVGLFRRPRGDAMTATVITVPGPGGKPIKKTTYTRLAES